LRLQGGRLKAGACLQRIQAYRVGAERLQQSLMRVIQVVVRRGNCASSFICHS